MTKDRVEDLHSFCFEPTRCISNVSRRSALFFKNDLRSANVGNSSFSDFVCLNSRTDTGSSFVVIKYMINVSHNDSDGVSEFNDLKCLFTESIM